MKKSLFAAIVFMVCIASCTHKAPSASGINAAEVYSKNCSHCHGDTGSNGRAKDLAKVTLNKTETIDVITKGHGHMPAFEDKLSKKEIEAVTTFVMAMRK